MPIYAYRCAACGHSRDVLQKMSDPVLSVCPVCGADQFQKQVTAAGFQLKGSGWYATATPAAAPAPAPAPAPSSDSGGASASTASAGSHGGGSCPCH
jgi:putative FmdB family regulatory protein